jgi:hypothetical protein
MLRLCEIEQIDWSALTCACGDARHVPEALYGLCGIELASAEQAFAQLDHHVVAHGVLFTAAKPIPGIIVALWPHTYFQELLAHLLYQIGSAALGHADALSQHCLEQAINAYQTILAGDNLDPAWADVMRADYRDLVEAES